MAYLKKEHIGEILTTQYDLVCNGSEVGGGSIRSHEPQVLETVFEIMGHKKEKIHEQFGHMLEAFEYGVPPHGGLAHGIERMLMVLQASRIFGRLLHFRRQAEEKQASWMLRAT